MTVTANTIIADALGSLGIIGSSDTVSGNDALLGLRVLNRMLDAWRQMPQMATHSAWVQFTLPANTQTMTIGTGGAVNTARPTTIETGAFSRFNGIDQPLDTITRDEYANLTLKTDAGSWPEAVYYEPANPLGTLWFWPLAGSNVTVYLPVRSHLAAFANLTTEVTLPDGYEAALVPNLAVRLAPYFERAVPQLVAMDAVSTRMAIKRTNAKVPQLEMAPRGESRLGAFLSGR